MRILRKDARHNYFVALVSRSLIKLQLLAGFKSLALKNYQNLAAFCTQNYIGTYRWHLIECDLLRIGSQHFSDINSMKHGDKIEHVLHVITVGYNVGGHTELLAQWITLDRRRKHSIVFTNQNVNIPDKINRLATDYDVELYNLAEISSLLEKAESLRMIAKGVDVVVLHTHPFDIVPTLAFSKPGGIPVILLNNADHLFWINTSIADLVLELRDFYIEIDKKRRKLTHAEYLPIPIRERLHLPKEKARSAIGIAEDKIILLSIASEYKFKPVEGYNYFESCIKVLDTCQEAILLIVGVAKDSELACKYKHQRIIYLGEINDTDQIEAACDIYVESFPFVSHTSMLQTVSMGKPSHMIFNPPLLNQCIKDKAFLYTNSEDEWRSELVRLIRNPEIRDRIALEQNNYLDRHHIDKNIWISRLEHCYSVVEGRPHVISKVGETEYIYSRNEKYLLKIFSGKSEIRGIVESKNYVFKVIIFIASYFVKISKIFVRG